jgi:NitT/TauT family transport system permease protein
LEFTHAALGHDGVVVLDDVDLTLEPGERAVLTDASGVGKTTFLHTLAGLLPVLKGDVHTPGELSMVFQETRLVEALDAAGNVLLVGAGGRAGDEVRDLLEELLPREALDRPVRELSGGQRRRVEIVRALAHPSSTVLMDEPFSSLDEQSHRIAAEFVLRHLTGRTLLVASHAPDDAELLAARAVSLT